MRRIRRVLTAVLLSLSLLVAHAAPADAHRRHRRPRVVRVAPAANDPVWDRLAQCESGGRWHLRGRRYSGGLQFAPSTWRSVGGKGRAYQASKAEQIERARILYSQRGWKPWPGCSRKMKLR